MSLAAPAPKRFFASALPALLLASLLGGCSQPLTVSVNSQPVYDPGGRLINSGVVDSDLQGCINIAISQQRVEDAASLTALSCASSGIRDLGNIGGLQALRFLDLRDNRISNITPLEELPTLGGLNLTDNAISDIGPLFNIPTLTSVSLQGNNNIPCNQLRNLRRSLGNNLVEPADCRE